jgi:hypothetical protein
VQAAPERKPAVSVGSLAALVAGGSSVLLVAITLLTHWDVPDLVPEVAIGLALLAVGLGAIATVVAAARARGRSAVVALAGLLLGGAVIAGFVWVISQFGENF